MSDFDANVINNMIIHYSGLMKSETKSFGSDFMSKSIFKDIDLNKDGKLQQNEIDKAIPNLATYIEKVLKTDDFYGNIHFGEEYTQALTQTTEKSDKTRSQQIIENNLNKAVNMIMQYAASNPNDKTIQKYANKLSEIIENNNLKLTDIESEGIVGRANKKENGTDEILIDNNDNINNLSVNYLLQTLLHELRHTFETDNINSKAEEIEAEKTARELQEKISGQKIFNNSIESFAKCYSVYAEASPGTYSIPENTGIAVWYKPVDVTMTQNNKLIIKSDIQESMNNLLIEDHVQFGNQKDENGNPYPISAKCLLKDKDGNIVQEFDYGDYNINTRSFNDYHKVHLQQAKLKINQNNNFFK